MDDSTLLLLLGLMHAGLVVSVLGQVRKRRRGMVEGRFDVDDRRLVGAMVFYLILPAVIGIRVAFEWLGFALMGGPAKMRFFIYWGEVVRPAQTEGLSAVLSALQGPMMLVVAAVALVYWAKASPKTARSNYVRLELARLLVWFALVVHPIVALIFGVGDYHRARVALNAMGPGIGNIAFAVLAIAVVAIYGRWRRRWRGEFLWLTTPFWDRHQAAEDALKIDPDNVKALLELSSIYLTANAAPRAVDLISRAVRLEPDDAKHRYVAGLVFLRSGDPDRASEHLRHAGSVLESAPLNPLELELYFEVTLGLAAARLALGDHEGAMLTVDAAREQRPTDTRVELMYADVLVASGRPAEAEQRLERALDTVDRKHDRGMLNEIRRRMRLVARAKKRDEE